MVFWTAVTAVASALALVLSARVWIHEVWQRRQAGIEARLEQYQMLSKRGEPANRERLVLVNHGPARAQNVQVKLLGPNEEALPMAEFDWDDKPVPTLHPGQQFHLPVLFHPDENPPSSAVIGWKDRRRKRQTLTIWLSMQDVF